MSRVFNDSVFNYQDVYDLAVEEGKDGDVFVELGVWKGESIIYLAEKVIESGKKINIFAVDLWGGNAFTGSTEKASMYNPTVYDEFIENLGNLKNVVKIVRMDSAKAADLFADKGVKFCFVDADHTYEKCSLDIIKWLPKVTWIMAGHDHHHQPVADAVDAIIGRANYIISGNTWIHKIQNTAIINVDSIDFETLCKNVATGVNFSLSRWGDGEWQCLLGTHTHNCDQHQYLPTLRQALKAVISSKPEYLLGIQQHSQRSMGKEIAPYHNNLKWCNADMMHNASISANLDEFHKAYFGKPG